MAPSIEDQIRQLLQSRISQANTVSGRQVRFGTASDMDLAVSVIKQRYDQLIAMSSRMSSKDTVTKDSVANTIAFLDARKANQPPQDFPTNSISLSSLLPPSANSNGLCALPSRIDCLSGAQTVYPDFHIESLVSPTDLVDLERIPVDKPPRVSNGDHIVNVKRMRIKHL